MGRRRQRDDTGAIADILNVSTRVPVFGFAIAGIFAMVAIGVWLWSGREPPTSVWRPLLPVLAFFFGVLSAMGVLGGIVGTIRCLATGRDLLGRKRHPAGAAIAWNDVVAASPEQFERIIADLFRQRGFRVSEVGGPDDGGVDLLLHRDDAIDHLVQCKHYRVQSVGPAAVRELYGVMAAHHTRCEGILITTGRFSDAARAFAQGKPIRLIDGQELMHLLQSTNPVTPVVDVHAPVPPRRAASTPPAHDAPTPICTRCNVPMVKHTATRGRHAGQPFWGCANYPKCREVWDERAEPAS